MTKEKKTKKRRGLIITVAVMAWLVLTAVLLVLADGRTVRFYMYGDDEITLEYGTEYVEPGVYAHSVGRIFGESREKLPVETLGQVDVNVLGSYAIEYRASSLFGQASTWRTVNIVDTQPPVIELEYVEGYEPTWITGYQEEGYRAYDGFNGDITDKVERQQFRDKVVYTVSDSSGNTVSVERPLPEYAEAPYIELIGGDYMELCASLDFEMPMYSAMDGMGNDFTDLVKVEGEVIPYMAGDYQLVYSLESEDGERIEAMRTVRVLPNELPAVVEPESRTIYLTFDDGPCAYTGRLLDLLSAYGVKATFFVTAAYPGSYDFIGRAYREGHSIGVHTSSHKYNEIYSSEQAFFDDFFHMQEIIYEQTGEYTKLFRFPGGSSNTVSAFNPGIMSRLSRIMTDLGYRFFDWNVSSGDAGETNVTQEIADNIIAGCSMHKTSCVLQHDIKDYSISAVEQVILWGQANGYSFEALSMTSPDFHHGINN